MTKIEQLVAALAAPANDIENAFQQLLLQRTIDAAVGAQLDQLGKLVGQPRGGLTDDDYRRYIRARIATNTSSGKTEQLINIAVLIVNDITVNVQVVGWTIATVVVTLAANAVTTSVAQITYSFLVQAKEAGVRLILIYSIVGPSTTFTLDGTAAQALDNGHMAGSIP